jgi:hypothetical protein
MYEETARLVNFGVIGKPFGVFKQMDSYDNALRRRKLEMVTQMLIGIPM